MEWYLAVLKKYAVFEGRARRKEYWTFTVFNIILIYIFLRLGSLPVIGVPFQALFWVYNLGTIIPTIAAAVRRLHDTGKSGNWYLISLIPTIGSYIIIGILVGMAISHSSGSALGSSIPVTFVFQLVLISIIPIAGLVWLIVLLARDGTPGSNKYGDDPKK